MGMDERRALPADALNVRSLGLHPDLYPKSRYRQKTCPARIARRLLHKHLVVFRVSSQVLYGLPRLADSILSHLAAEPQAVALSGFSSMY